MSIPSSFQLVQFRCMLQSVLAPVIIEPLPTSSSYPSLLSLSSMNGFDKAFNLSSPIWSSPVAHLSYSLAASTSEYLVARSRLHKTKCLAGSESRRGTTMSIPRYLRLSDMGRVALVIDVSDYIGALVSLVRDGRRCEPAGIFPTHGLNESSI